MDLSPLIAEAFKLWYVIPVLFVIAFFKSPWFKGRFGEWLVNRSIKRHFDSETYHLIKDVTLPTKSGTTQIDHILVSPYGVFVIETKNMKGWIFGNSKQARWTVTNYGKKHKFQNPVRQNFRHLKVLQKLLNLDNHQLHSLVIFVGSSTFKTPMPNNVVKGGKYRSFIESKKEVVLSDAQITQIIAAIDTGRLERSFKTNREHVKHVNKLIADKDRNEDKLN